MRMVNLLVKDGMYSLYRESVISQQDFTNLFNTGNENYEKITDILPFYSFTNYTDLKKDEDIILRFINLYSRNIITYTQVQNEYNITYYGEKRNHHCDIYILLLKSDTSTTYCIMTPIQTEENKVEKFRNKILYTVLCELLDNFSSIKIMNEHVKELNFSEEKLMITFK